MDIRVKIIELTDKYLQAKTEEEKSIMQLLMSKRKQSKVYIMKDAFVHHPSLSKPLTFRCLVPNINRK